MNRRGLVVAAVVAATAIVGTAGVLGALGGSPIGVETPTDDASDEGTTLDHEGDLVTVHNATGQVVAGTADLAPGTEVTVRLESTDGSSPFLKQGTATVGDDGRFEAAFDFFGIEPGTGFNVTVLDATGEQLTNASGEVTPGGPGDGATPTATPEGPAAFDHDGERLTLVTASGQEVGGTADLAPGTEVTVRLESTEGTSPFVKTRKVTVAEDGSFAATFDLSTLDPGEVTAAVVHDGDEIVSVPGEVREAE